MCMKTLFLLSTYRIRLYSLIFSQFCKGKENSPGKGGRRDDLRCHAIFTRLVVLRNKCKEICILFYLPPWDIFSSFPLFYIEVFTLVFPCAYRTTVIKCPSISLSDILRHFVTVVSPVRTLFRCCPSTHLQPPTVHPWKCFKCFEIHH